MQNISVMSTKEYFEDKSKMYYEDYLNHRCTQKVRGIIVNDMGQILLLFSKKHNGFSIPGGTIEQNETIKDAVIREVFEETGAEILPVKPVGKYYHTARGFMYKGIKFDSARVEYFYFCKFKGFKADNLGLNGEFDYGDVKIMFLDYEQVMRARLMRRDKSMIERAINEFLLYQADKLLDADEQKLGEDEDEGQIHNYLGDLEIEEDSDSAEFVTFNGRGEITENIDDKEYLKRSERGSKRIRFKKRYFNRKPDRRVKVNKTALKHGDKKMAP